MGELRKQRAYQRRIKRARRCIACLLIGSVIFLIGKTVQFSRGIKTINRVEYEQKNYPKSLIDLAERNPEAVSFVRYYEKYDGDPDSIDVSGEIHKGEIPLFLQWDERWGYETYGNDFLAVTGCGPTCLSMVYCGITGRSDLNPYAMAKLAEREGYYVAGGGSSWNMMEGLASEIGLQVDSVVFDEAHIRKLLQEGKPVICIMGPGDFTTTGHFIVLTGIGDNGDVLVNDPNSKKNSEKSWSIEKLIPQIRNLWTYS